MTVSVGAIVPPTGVPTLASLWQRPTDGVRAPGMARAPGYVMALGLVVVGVVVVAGLAYGTNEREGTRGEAPVAEIRADPPFASPGSVPVAASIARPG